jgi:hypothetical protein
MVSTDGIPHDVAAFLQDDVESVRELEALLLLRAQPRVWSAQQVSRELRSGVTWSEQQLEGLRAKGLLEVAPADSGEPGFRYAPRDPRLDDVVGRVADLYSRREHTVIELIFGQPRRDSVRSFADAFRIRKDR